MNAPCTGARDNANDNANGNANNDTNDTKLIQFLHQIPKVELHAHLNGCIRESTLLELAKERNVTLSPLLHDLQIGSSSSSSSSSAAAATRKSNKKQRSLPECFEIFAEISNCVTDLDALRRITQEALHDFAAQNVKYLELRSTPKILYYTNSATSNQIGTNHAGTSGKSERRKATKKDYIDTILRVFEEFEKNSASKCAAHTATSTDRGAGTGVGPMIPRFIISVNRAESVDDAMENASLAIAYKKQNNKYIVGLDLSGNPLKNTFTDLEPAFTSVRNAGLKTAIHFGEIPCDETNEDDFATKDTNAILSFKPDRLGHSLLLTQSMFDTLDKMDDGTGRIPVECCPTSNVMTLELAKNFDGDLVSGLKRHPRLKHWIDDKYPISINTDDPGIFNTDSTLELVLLVEAFDLCATAGDGNGNGNGNGCPSIIVDIIEESVGHCFESEGFRMELKKSIGRHMQLLMEQYYGENLKN